MAGNSNRNRVWSVASILSLLSSSSSDDHDEKKHSCGLFGHYPKFLQKLATPRCFLVCFCVKNILQGMIFTYLVGIETSLERHFQFDGKSIGLLLTLGEIGPILTAVVISYFGSKGNRPRWMTFGLLLISLSLVLAFLMNSAFDPPKLASAGMNKLCLAREDELGTPLANVSSIHEECTIDSSRKNLAFGAWVVIYSIMGIGGTTVYTIGAPYLDDSISKQDSAMYFGITVAVRIVGPVFGYLLSAAVLKLNVQPGHNPGYSSSDPRWIGAWWLGMLIIAVLTCLFALIIAAFPQELPREKNNSDLPGNDMEQPDKNKADLKASIRRLLRNRILMYSCGSSIFTVMGLAGFFVWLPKFFEHEFRLTKSQASMYSGISGNSTMIFGVLLSSYLMKKYRPSGRNVALVVAATKYVYAVGLLILMVCGCGYNADLPGTLQSDGSLMLDGHCNSGCGCSTNEFVPVCYRGPNDTQRTYFSPCHAGCSQAVANSSRFTNCRCTSMEGPVNNEVILEPGFCNKTCWIAYVYMFLLAVIKFIVSTSTIGNLIIDLRCVEPQDKALALGLLAAVSGLLGFLPNPIIYGTLIDSSCLVWEESCGQRGSCWVYDTEAFRYKLHGLTAGLLIIAAFFETLTFVEAKNLKLTDADKNVLP